MLSTGLRRRLNAMFSAYGKGQRPLRCPKRQRLESGNMKRLSVS